MHIFQRDFIVENCCRRNFCRQQKFVFRKVNSPFLNLTHKIKKGENLNNVFKSYNIDQKDINKANSKLKKFIKPKKSRFSNPKSSNPFISA